MPDAPLGVACLAVEGAPVVTEREDDAHAALRRVGDEAVQGRPRSWVVLAWPAQVWSCSRHVSH